MPDTLTLRDRINDSPYLRVVLPVALLLFIPIVLTLGLVQTFSTVQISVAVNNLPYVLLPIGMFILVWQFGKRFPHRYHILTIFVNSLLLAVTLAVSLSVFDVVFYRVIEPDYEIRANTELRELYRIETARTENKELKADLNEMEKYFDDQIRTLRERPTPLVNIFFGLRLRLLLAEGVFFSFLMAVLLRPNVSGNTPLRGKKREAETPA